MRSMHKSLYCLNPMYFFHPFFVTNFKFFIFQQGTSSEVINLRNNQISAGCEYILMYKVGLFSLTILCFFNGLEFSFC